MRVVHALAEGGCVAPQEEADALLRASSEGVGPVDELVARRLRGEPLAWIIGSVSFCGIRVGVDPGVYVPRPHTQALARRAVSLLPAQGVAVDMCTGSGAVAAVLGSAHPHATIVATDIDPVAVACARNNDVNALEGNLDEPLSPSMRGRVDVMTAPSCTRRRTARNDAAGSGRRGSRALAAPRRQRAPGARRGPGGRGDDGPRGRRPLGDPRAPR